MEEGCLSIPRVLVDVKRAKTVWVEFTDQENRQVRAQLNGLVAKVFQHEYDHLQGKLILDYLPPKDRSKIVSQMKKGSYTGNVLGDDDETQEKFDSGLVKLPAWFKQEIPDMNKIRAMKELFQGKPSAYGL